MNIVMRYISLILIFLFSLGHALQGKVTSKKSSTNYAAKYEMAVKYQRAYDFSQALELLEGIRNKSDVPDSLRYLSQLLYTQVATATEMLNHVQKVIVTDSVQVDLSHVYSFIRISKPSGQILDKLPSELGSLPLDAYVYRSANGNLLCWAGKNDSGASTIYSSFRLSDSSYSEAIDLLAENQIDDVMDIRSPYLLSDGITLYFAAQAENNLGGLDIYVTRKDLESNRFLNPQNLGFPFNSPYNEYFMIIDEVRSVGYLATDRFCPEGKAVIYTFHYTPERTNYPISEPNLQQLASLLPYSSTQSGAYIPAQSQKPELEGHYSNETTYYPGILYAGDRYIHTSDDCNTPMGKELFNQLLSVHKLRNELIIELSKLRAQWEKGNKANLSQQILIKEGELNSLNDKEKQLSVSIVKLEDK